MTPRKVTAVDCTLIENYFHILLVLNDKKIHDYLK